MQPVHIFKKTSTGGWKYIRHLRKANIYEAIGLGVEYINRTYKAKIGFYDFSVVDETKAVSQCGNYVIIFGEIQEWDNE